MHSTEAQLIHNTVTRAQGQCAPATSGAAADHLIHLLKDRAAVVAAEEAPAGKQQASPCASRSVMTLPATHSHARCQAVCPAPNLEVLFTPGFSHLP